MLRRAAATLLLILTASPFTAPFVTCDVLTLFGKHTTAAQYQHQAPRAATDDQSQVVAMRSLSRRERVRHKSIAPASTPAVDSSAPSSTTGAFAVAAIAPTPLHVLTRRTPLRI